MKKWIALALACMLLVSLVGCAGENAPTEPSETPAPTATEQPTVSLSGSGTQDDPWLVGSSLASSVRLYAAETVLIAEGEGEMMDFQPGDVLPWTYLLPTVEMFFWDSGIVNVGAYGFCGIGRDAMGVSVYLPTDLSRIGAGAFENAVFIDGTTIPESTQTVESRAFAGISAYNVDLEGYPQIAEDAFAGAQTVIRGRSASGWTMDPPAFCSGSVTWTVQHTFSYEVYYGTDDLGMYGSIYLSEDEPYSFDAVIDCGEEGYHFVSYELLEGDFPLENPTSSLLELNLTGDVRMRINFEAD